MSSVTNCPLPKTDNPWQLCKTFRASQRGLHFWLPSGTLPPTLALREAGLLETEVETGETDLEEVTPCGTSVLFLLFSNMGTCWFLLPRGHKSRLRAVSPKAALILGHGCQCHTSQWVVYYINTMHRRGIVERWKQSVRTKQSRLGNTVHREPRRSTCPLWVRTDH